MFGVEQKVTAAARKAALFSASAIFASVGTAFLTVAAWLVLSELKSAVFAATIIGIVYLGLGLIGFGFASVSYRRRTPPQHSAAEPPAELSPLQLVVVSFLQGIEQGARSNRKS